MYKDYQAGFGVSNDYEEYPESLIYSYHLLIYLTEEEIIQSLGEPTSEEFSEVDNVYYMYYRLEIMNYFLKRIRTIQLSATIIGSDEGENLKQ